MRAYLSPYEQSVRTLEPYQPNYQLSENNLYQYRQAKLNNKNIKITEQGEQSKCIRQLGAKFAKNSTNKDSSQLDRTAIRTTPIGADRSYISNVESIKTTKEPAMVFSTISQPVGQYAVYNPSPTITYTSNVPTTTYTPAPISFSYTTSTHHPFIYPQQLSQPLASIASKPTDLTASSTAQK
jgi:hypothetical protein